MTSNFEPEANGQTHRLRIRISWILKIRESRILTNFKNKIRSVSLDIIHELLPCTKMHAQVRQVLRRRYLLLFIVYAVYTATVLC